MWILKLNISHAHIFFEIFVYCIVKFLAVFDLINTHVVLLILGTNTQNSDYEFNLRINNVTIFN